MSPTLLLCADSGPGIGVGHVSRCVAFAEEAVARGWPTFLAADPAWFAPAGVQLLPPAPTAADVRARIKETGADLVLIDDYRLTGDLSVEGTLLITMTDGTFGRRPADLAIDGNLTTAPDYPARVVLRGPRFAPLRQVIRTARARRSSVAGNKVVVVMGGGAWSKVTEAVLAALRDTKSPLDALAVAPPPIAVPAALPGQRFEATGPRTDLPDLFADADLVISAAGVTLLELCCIGVPTALVCLTDNQAPGYGAAVSRGLAAGLGTAADLLSDPASAVEVLRDLLQDPSRRAVLASSGAAEVDGAGAGRVLDVALAMATVRPREATPADAELLLEWRNDPETRAWSRSSDPVSLADHRAWLDSVLSSEDRLLLVIDSAAGALGTVRFDRSGADWEVSITVAPAFRGRGLASLLLSEGEAELSRQVSEATVLACVHEDNARSTALFQRAGYTERSEQPDGEFRWFAKPVTRRAGASPWFPGRSRW